MSLGGQNIFSIPDTLYDEGYPDLSPGRLLKQSIRRKHQVKALTLTALQAIQILLKGNQLPGCTLFPLDL